MKACNLYTEGSMNDFKVDLNKEDYWKGYQAGYERKRFAVPAGVDGLSFSSAYIEGKADRNSGKAKRSKK